MHSYEKKNEPRYATIYDMDRKTHMEIYFETWYESMNVKSSTLKRISIYKDINLLEDLYF